MSIKKDLMIFISYFSISCIVSFSVFYTAIDMYHTYFNNDFIDEGIIYWQYLIDEDFDIDDEETEWIEI